MFGPDFIYLDLETTGLNNGLKLDEPVQIGIVDHTGAVLLNTLVKPTVAIDPEASVTHGISAASLENAPTFADILPELQRVIDGKTVVIYNAAYDVRILINAAFNRGVILEPFRYECAMLTYLEKWAPGQDVRYQKLTAACEQQGITIEDAHDAVADSQMTRQLCEVITGGKIKAADAPYGVTLVSICKKVARNNNAYLSFTTAGGQMVNVFSGGRGSRHLLESAGYPLAAWESRLDTDFVQPLSERNYIQAVVKLENGYLNLTSINSAFLQAVAS